MTERMTPEQVQAALTEALALVVKQGKMLELFIHLYQRGDEPGRWELAAEDDILADLARRVEEQLNRIEFGPSSDDD